ncbi:peptidase M20 domain-containing protein 2 [Trichonephila clavata]|uniref:Peptidase M20 domain-containing protein 2 n=1 Tax=Trichonephila clavata TaxID=2740835 RepID=A0A8X6LZ39_TRICU|nr:peptidase M20 domain-containing protein 2 [Trichonephila clavata]
MDDRIFEAVNSTVENEANFLSHVSQEIWKFPELKHEEKVAHDLLTNALEQKGFSVERHYILPTAFRAEFTSGKTGPTIVVICEYDALPKIGHACGHNLIAESGLGAGIAIKSALEVFPEISGKVVVLGTPAEEGGGGKVTLIKGGAFKDVDAALMVHPSPDNHLYPPFIAISRKTIKFTGREAHASGYPWEGLNALDAVVGAYNNLALLRQHIKPTCRVHAIITKGGEAPNVIPGNTEMKLYYRGPTNYEMENLNKRIDSCMTAAAISTGCEVSIENEDDDAYQSLMTNKILAERYKKYAEKLGVQFDDGNNKKIPFMASSDMGDVSHVVPSIHPTYSIGTRAVNHSVEFTQASGTPEAHLTTLITAKSMAMVALDLMQDKDFLKKAKEQFQIDLAEDVGH